MTSPHSNDSGLGGAAACGSSFSESASAEVPATLASVAAPAAAATSATTVHRDASIDSMVPIAGAGSGVEGEADWVADVGYEAVDPPEDLICAVCNNLLTEAVQTACDHHFCADCLSRALKVKNNCPICRKADPGIGAASRLIRSMINKQKVRCAQPDCAKEMLREVWDAHLARCEHSPIACTHAVYGCRERVSKLRLADHVRECAFAPRLYKRCVLNAKIDIDKANVRRDVIDLPVKREGVVTHRNCMTFSFNGDDVVVLRPGIVSVTLTVVVRARDGWAEQHERYHGLGVQINGILAAYSLFPRRVKKGDCVSATVSHHCEVAANESITFRIGMASKKLIGDLQAQDISLRWDTLE